MIHLLGDASDGEDDKYEGTHLHISLGEQELRWEVRVVADEYALPVLPSTLSVEESTIDVCSMIDDSEDLREL